MDVLRVGKGMLEIGGSGDREIGGSENRVTMELPKLPEFVIAKIRRTLMT